MYYSKHIQGFTLLETLTAVAILATIIVGPLAVIVSSSSYARQTKDAVVATYLAEESIELLENQYDSLYLLCKKQPENVLCTPLTGENSGNTSWRLFKERLNSKDHLGVSNGQPSCFLKMEDGSDDNIYGCSYDYQSMVGDITTVPVRYVANTSECPYLVELITSKVVDGIPGGEDREAVPTSVKSLHTYVCKGVESHTSAGVLATTTKTYSRSVFIEQLPTFETGSMFTQYNDDLRIISQVKYKGVNGVTYSARVVRFMHAQQ